MSSVLKFPQPAAKPAPTAQPAPPVASPPEAPAAARRRMSAAKWFAIAALFLALLIALAVYLFEWNMLRPYIARHVSESTGRTFAINGDLSVKLSLTPRIVVRDVVLGNAAWSQDTNMAEIGALEFTLDGPGLWQRRIVLPQVTISNARVVLEKNADGVPNWDFGQIRPSGWGFPEIAGMTIDRARLDYRDPATRTKVIVEASTITDAQGSETAMLRVAAAGQFKGLPTKVNGEVGNVLELRTPENPYPVKLRGTVGATRARLDGVLLDPLKLGGEDLNFELAGADMSQLLPIIGVPLPPTPAYKLSGHLNHKGAVWTFRKFSGTVGKSDLAGDFTVDRGKKPQFITANLTSRNLDMNDLGGFVGGKRGERASPQPPAPGRVLPQEPFDLEKLRIAEFDVRFKGQHVMTQKLPLTDMSAHLKVKNGVVTLTPLNFGVAGGNLVSNITMDARAKTIRTRADVAARQVHLERLFPDFKLNKANSGVITGRARLVTTGNSVARMLADADGDVAFMMEGGSVSELLTRLSHLDLAHTVALLLTGDKQLPVRCMVTHLEGTNGRFGVNTMVLDTQKARITGAGNVDFRRETLDLRLVSKPKDFSLAALRGPIEVSGSFANPTVRPDLRSAVGRGALAVALGLVTGGVGAIIPLLEFGGEKDSNCAELVKSVG